MKINATLEASRRRVSFLFYERTARLVQEFDNNHASYTVEVYIAADLVLFPSFVSHSIWSLPTCNSTPTCAINYIYIYIVTATG